MEMKVQVMKSSSEEKWKISGELCRLGGRSDRGVSGIYSTDRKSSVESKTTVTDVINCLYYNDIKSEGL